MRVNRYYYCTRCGSVITELFMDSSLRIARVNPDGSCLFCGSRLHFLEEAALHERDASRLGNALSGESSKIYTLSGGVFELVRRKLVFPSPDFDRQQHEVREELEEKEFFREIVLKEYISLHSEMIKTKSLYCQVCGNIAVKGFCDSPSPVCPNGRLNTQGRCIFCQSEMREFYDYAFFSQDTRDSGEEFWFAPFTAPEYEAIRRKYVYNSPRFNILLCEKRERTDRLLALNNQKALDLTSYKKLKGRPPAKPASPAALSMNDVFSSEPSRPERT